MAKPPSREVKFQIIVQTPPSGVDFGLQLGKGSEPNTVQTQRSNGGDLRFEFSLSVVDADPPDFRGPGVQGKRGERFIYLDIGKYAGQVTSEFAGRMKVPLTRISQELIDRAPVLEARVPGTGRNGAPYYATVKPFDGWKIGENSRT